MASYINVLFGVVILFRVAEVEDGGEGEVVVTEEEGECVCVCVVIIVDGLCSMYSGGSFHGSWGGRDNRGPPGGNSHQPSYQHPPPHNPAVSEEIHS